MTFNLKRIHKAVNWNKEDDGFTQAFWEQNVKQFWLPEEISVSKDLKCWSMLSEKEKELYTDKKCSTNKIIYVLLQYKIDKT